LLPTGDRVCTRPPGPVRTPVRYHLPQPRREARPLLGGLTADHPELLTLHEGLAPGYLINCDQINYAATSFKMHTLRPCESKNASGSAIFTALAYESRRGQ